MPRKILIVNDNAINRRLLINMLKSDYNIIEAADGKQALDLIGSQYKELSAILLDIVMPEINGYEVLRRMRENHLYAKIPVIVVTGSEDETSRAKALELGASDFILEPFNPDIIKHCVHNNILLYDTSSILCAIQMDKLTGLYNRETFLEKVTEMVAAREPGYYFMSSFDIDNFKLINDQFGTADGDRILKEIGTAVRQTLHEIGGIGGRISADNFAALIPCSNKDNNIIQRLRDRNFVILQNKSIGFSIGRYLVTDLSIPASAIYDRAYIANRSVKGRYDKHLAYFDENMLQKIVRDQQIIEEMEQALDERQFEIWLQPQYNHVTGAQIGAEALVRWRHPQKGIVSPAEFIPLFEQTGFIYELDKYVWRETCRYLRKWIDAGYAPLPISVNISRYDIIRSDLVDVIVDIAKEYNIPITLLRLEITESAFAKSTNLIVSIVKQLIDLGFIVEIDDFGSGYSSLNTLKSVPAQIVKLDMRFLEDNDDTQRGGNIIESIIRMAKWLNMSVIAEGVETQEQGDFLKSIGCSLVQGYLYARPMPTDQYESYFRNADKDAGLIAIETVEHLDNNMFWNPNSMDTLIFNNYVGAACIYEYSNGGIELVRATDKYAKMLGGKEITVEDVLKFDIMCYLHEKSYQDVITAMQASRQNKQEETVEFLFTDLPGCAHETYLRSTLRVIASTGERCLIYCINENITAQRLLERTERRISKQLQIVMDNINCGVSAVIVNGDELTYLLANDMYFSLLGYTREQYKSEVGSYAYGTIYPDDKEHVKDTVSRVCLTGKATSMEYRAIRRDGNIIWVRSLISMTEFEDIDAPVQLCTYADITSEKNLTQELLDNLPCGAGICIITEDDARMTYINKRYFSYFKHNTGSIRNTSVFSVVHPDDRGVLREAIMPAFQSGGEGTCVVRIMDAPGEYISFRLVGVAMEYGGNSNAIYVTFTPISHERMSFGEMLPIALEAMMASSSNIAFVKDKNLRYICCSRVLGDLIGITSESDIVGKTDHDLFDKSYADQYVACDRKLIESGQSIIDIVEQLPSLDGGVRFCNMSKYLLHDSLGHIVGVYGIGRDITKAREEKNMQDFLIDAIPGGVAVYEGVWSTLENMRLTYFSDGFCKLFGYTKDEYEALDNNSIGHVEKEFLPDFSTQLKQLVKYGTPVDYTYRACCKGNIHRWIHVKAVPGERSNDVITVNAVFFDVTSRQCASD